jgi:hypothetical protein
VDTTAGRSPSAQTLLVRRAVPAGEQDVAALLRDVPIERVYAYAESVGAGASLLASADFAGDSGAVQAKGRSRFSLTL